MAASSMDWPEYSDTMETPGTLLWNRLRKVRGELTSYDVVLAAAQEAISKYVHDNPSTVEVVDPAVVENYVIQFMEANWEQMRGDQGIEGKAGRDGTDGNTPSYDAVLAMFTSMVNSNPATFTGPRGVAGKDGENVNPETVATQLMSIFESNIDRLVGPRGLKGDKGDKGDTGASPSDESLVTKIKDIIDVDPSRFKGNKGDRGDQGLQGIAGSQGDKGDKGEAGVQGIQGLKGDTGLQGIQGLKGDTGLQGIQGLKGDQGIQGLKGDTGNPKKIRTGEAKLPLLALGIPYDATVTLSGAMNTTSYEVEILKGATLLGNATAVVKTKNLSSVVLTITPGVLLSAGAAIMVICYE